MSILEGLFVIGLVAIALVMLPGIAIAALGPIDKAAGAINAPTRFQLSDLLWLSALLQGVLAFCSQTIEVDLREAFLPILGFLTLTVVALWGVGVSFLSRAGVVSIWKRACLLLLSLPVTLAMMIITTIGVVFSIGGAGVYFEEVARGERVFDTRLATYATLMAIACAVGMAGLAWGLRRLSLWIVAGIAAVPEPKGSNIASNDA